MTFPTSWREPFEAALRESDEKHRPERVQQARTAIMQRIDQSLDDPDWEPEHDDLLRALNRLGGLTRS